MHAPRVAIQTVGCRLNQAESALLAARFERAGYAVVPAGSSCELFVVHGCAVTRRAEADSRRAVRRALRAVPAPLVVLAGCPAEALRAPLTRELPSCLLVGQADKWRLPALVHAAHPDRFPAPPAEDRTGPGPTPRFDTVRAAIKVQDGCDFRCAYCIVPAARGAQRSRSAGDVIAEIRRVTVAGVREMVLTGANLGLYRDGALALPDLLDRILEIPGIDRIRLSSIELSTVERGVIDRMAATPRFCRFLHLPLQSGSDRILSAMGRRYTRRAYAAAVAYAADRLPGLGLGTDLLVGFPGEDETAFGETVALVRDLPFSNLHVFPFSPRPGTRAVALGDPIPPAAKRARVETLLALGEEKRAAFAREFLGRPVQVLIERITPRGEGRGWTGEYLDARLSGPGLAVNHVVEFRPTEADGPALRGVATRQAEP